jgi:hypothetical protein
VLAPKIVFQHALAYYPNTDESGWGYSNEEMLQMLLAFYGGEIKGLSGELVAATGGLFDKQSSIFAENYLGLVDTSDPNVQMGIWAERVSVGVTVIAVGSSTTIEVNTGTHYLRLLNKELLKKGFRIDKPDLHKPYPHIHKPFPIGK